MKLGMAQMCMADDMDVNLGHAEAFCREASAKGCDLLFFPEIQLTPFFPQYTKDHYPDGRIESWCLQKDSVYIRCLQEMARANHLYLSPNVYLSLGGKPYDASLFIRPDGTIEGISKMVHIAQAPQFYEQDYYTPSDDGFRVFDTPFGKVAIVICYDRHIPESIRLCALMGADLVIIPTANVTAEPLELFAWEVRVQAMQNQVFAAMCNRTGREGAVEFAGESIVADPRGSLVCLADRREQLVTCQINLADADRWREKMPYLGTRRTECYGLLTEEKLR